MKYFFGNNKKLNEICISIYGVGTSRLAQLLKEVGLCAENNGLSLDKAFSLCSERMDLKLEDFLVGDSLKQKLASIFLRYKQVGHYRGLRISQNLPCRGQRTKTNSKTAKRLKHFEIDQKSKMIIIKKIQQKKEQRYKTKNKYNNGKFKVSFNYKYGKTNDARNFKRLQYSHKLKFGV